MMSSSGLLAVGADAGGGPHVRVFDAASGEERASFFPYNAGFTGGVRVAVGNVGTTAIPMIVTAPGAGGGPHVRVYRLPGSTPQLEWEFYAYHPGFSGGVQIALGDFDADGHTDIVTGAGAGGGPHVRVFSGRTRGLIFEFFAYNASFSGGVNVAAGDVDGDGHADVIVGAGPGGGPHVRVISGRTHAQIDGPLASFYAYTPNFSGGVHVAAGNLNLSGLADIVTGPGSGGGPHVKVFSAIDGSFQETMAYNPAFTGGVRVGVADADGDGSADVVTAPGPGGGPHIRAFDGSSLSALDEFFAFSANFLGGLFASGEVSRITGDVKGTFSNPVAPPGATYVINNHASAVSWGAIPDSGATYPGRSSLEYSGVSFKSATDDFELGELKLINRENLVGTGLNSILLTVKITLPGAESKELTIPISIVTTPNDGTPVQDADSIVLPSAFPKLTFDMPDGGLRILKVLGFYNSEGEKVDELVVKEGQANGVTLRAKLDLAVDLKNGGFLKDELLAPRYLPGVWSTPEKDTIRDVIKFMIDHAGDTAIVKANVAGRLSNQLTFVRQGRRESGHTTPALNGDKGVIYITDAALEHDPALDLLRTTVLHELGHHRDEPHENPYYSQFVNISDWGSWYGFEPSGYTRSRDGFWIYASTAPFVSTYARTSPLEDIADTFGVYFASAWGRSYYADSTFQSASTLVGRAPSKINLIDQLVRDLTAP